MPDDDPMNDPFDHALDSAEGGSDGPESFGDGARDESVRALQERLSRLPGPDAPPLASILARGRGYKHRRKASFVGAATAAAAVAAGLPLYLSQQREPVNADLAGFVVASRPDGTVSLAIQDAASVKPSELTTALAKAGVRAFVRAGAYCDDALQSSPWTASPLFHTEAASKGGAILIKPSAIPRHAELSIGYQGKQVDVGIMPSNTTLTCVAPAAVGCASGSQAAVTPPGPAATTVPTNTSVPVGAPVSGLPASTLPANTTVPVGAPVSGLPASTLPTGTSATPGSGVSWCQVELLQPGSSAATTSRLAG
jgi:hypothetical protein